MEKYIIDQIEQASEFLEWLKEDKPEKEINGNFITIGNEQFEFRDKTWDFVEKELQNEILEAGIKKIKENQKLNPVIQFIDEPEDGLSEELLELVTKEPLKYTKNPEDFFEHAKETVGEDRYTKATEKGIKTANNIKEGKKYTIVESTKQYNEMINHINLHEIIAYDTEATGLQTLTDKVIGFSVSGKEGIAYYLPIYLYNKEKDEIFKYSFADKVQEVLAILKTKKLVMWNGSYDVRITRNDPKVNLVDSLYADVQQMKHTLIEEGFFGLKETAIQFQKEIGIDAEKIANEEQIELKANVIKNGGSWTAKSKQMYKADLPILGKYACSDADLTLRLYNYFHNRIVKENLSKFFYEDETMPLYREVTIPMESFGVCLDLPKIEENRKAIIKDIEILKSKVIEELLDKSEVQEWIDETATEKYPPKKSGKFAHRLADICGLDCLINEKTGKYSFSKKFLEKLEDGDIKWFLETGDGSLLTKRLKNTIARKLWSDENGGLVNISSKTQLKGIIFGKLGIKAKVKTKKGAPTLNEDIIHELAEKYKWDWLVTLSTYNKLIKIKGTYIDRFLENHVDGKFYFYYKQHGTISGRYSSDAQQLPSPKEEGELPEVVLKYSNDIRSFFISESGSSFIDCDYESLEPHVFAHVSTDEGLRDIFRKGHDFYSTIAIATEKLSGLSADKKAENYLGKLNKQCRQKAKSYCLGIPYGMEGYALGKALEVETEEAEDLIRGYLDAYPNLEKWMKKSDQQAHYKGFVKSETGRVRHLPRVKELFSRHGSRLGDYKYRMKLRKILDKDEIIKIYRDYKNGVNNAKNFQIQSLAASIVNRAAIAINIAFKKLGITGQVIAQIHDQLIFNVADEDIEVAIEVIRDLMKNTTKLSLELDAPPELCKNWADGH